MANQLLLFPDQGPDHYRWCWLDSDLRPALASAARGDLETLASVLGEGHHTAWLILPGAKVVTRELEYTEAEKKHLRRLLPFQMEETVIGDIDQFHFALGPARNGRASVAYVEKPWLREIFAQLEPLSIDIMRCSPMHLLLPLPADLSEASEGDPSGTEHYPHWTLQLQEDELLVHYAPNQGYSVDTSRGRLSLQMLLTAQNRVDNFPRLTLRASTDEELQALEALLPAELADQVDSRSVVEFWELDFTRPATDLCQGEFSQRLPIERWWRDWRGLAAAAAACFVVYIGALVYEVQNLEAQNMEVRQEIEQVYRRVAGEGAIQDAERQLEIAVSELQPASAGRRVTPFLADLLPALEATEDVGVRAISYSGNNGEVSLNVQAGAFSSIETLRERIGERGLEAELLNASAQGDVHSARLRISQQPL